MRGNRCQPFSEPSPYVSQSRDFWSVTFDISSNESSEVVILGGKAGQVVIRRQFPLVAVVRGVGVAGDSQRRGLAIFLGLGGVATAGLAFWQAEVAENSELVGRLLGGGGDADRTFMWVLIGATAFLFLGSLLTWLSIGRDDRHGF